MAQHSEPVQFDEFLSNAASIFSQIEKEGHGVLVEHDGTFFSVKIKKPGAKMKGKVILLCSHR